MDNKAKVSICLVAIIFLFGTLLMSGVAFAQQGQGQQSVKITVTDGVTGKAADRCYNIDSVVKRGSSSKLGHGASGRNRGVSSLWTVQRYRANRNIRFPSDVRVLLF